ncbi:MAG: bactofilin family protein [Candidatus Binataceae bacterium]
MALFNKEPDKNARIDQTAKPQLQPAVQAVQPVVAAPVPPPPAPERPAAAQARPAQSLHGEMRAYLDSGTKISGKLSFDGPTRIDGQVDGEIVAKDSLTIGESAVVTAQIKAASITVAGKVSGDITAAQRIEIRPSARVLGNLTSPVLVVHEGALFEGHCSMQPEATRDDRKVTVFPKEERLAQAGGQKQA